MTRRQFVFSLLLLKGSRNHYTTAGGGTDTVKVAGVVIRWIRDGDYREANWERVSRLIRKAAAKGAKIVCTTECFLDGYHVEVSDRTYADVKPYLEDVVTSQYVRRLKELARALNIYIAAGMAVADPQRRDPDENPKPFNSCQLYSPVGALIGIYYKTHNWNKRSPWFEQFPDEEKKACFPTFPTNFGRLGCMICNDRYFAETTSWLRQNGAELILCPTGGAFDYSPVIERSSESGVGIVWVHPCGFAATTPDGKLITAKLWEGRQRSIAESEVAGPEDHQEVFVVDMPISPLAVDRREPSQPSARMDRCRNYVLTA